MSFTTADVVSVDRGVRQGGQGIWSDMWFVVLDIDVQSLAAGAENFDDFTIPGIVRSDHVISWAMDNSPGTSTIIQPICLSDDTMRILLTNVHASSAVDLLQSNWKILIGRPNW
jgi:hypothetical protein